MARGPDPTRRGLLFGARAACPPLRPPWAAPESLFTDACTACGACIRDCPEQVLVAGGGRHPVFEPKLGECTFCGACAAACPTQALDRAWPLRGLVAEAGKACLPKAGIVCSSCRDACPTQAVRFPLRARIPVPDIDADACTGCGACVAVCPVGAIALQEKQPVAA